MDCDTLEEQLSKQKQIHDVAASNNKKYRLYNFRAIPFTIQKKKIVVVGHARTKTRYEPFGRKHLGYYNDLASISNIMKSVGSNILIGLGDVEKKVIQEEVQRYKDLLHDYQTWDEVPSNIKKEFKKQLHEDSKDDGVAGIYTDKLFNESSLKYHYFCWPDGEISSKRKESNQHIVKVLEKIFQIIINSKCKTVFLSCGEGWGRTGIMLVTLYLWSDLFDEMKVSKEEAEVLQQQFIKIFKFKNRHRLQQVDSLVKKAVQTIRKHDNELIGKSSCLGLMGKQKNDGCSVEDIDDLEFLNQYILPIAKAKSIERQANIVNTTAEQEAREVKEKAEQEAKEEAEQEAKEKTEQEQAEREAREAERLAQEQAREAERLAQEQAEREAREEVEREAKEKAEQKRYHKIVEILLAMASLGFTGYTIRKVIINIMKLKNKNTVSTKDILAEKHNEFYERLRRQKKKKQATP